MITLPTPSALPAGLSTAKATYYANVNYGQAHADRKFDFLKTTRYNEPAPLVVFVHGGGFTSGTRSFIETGADAADVVSLVNLGFSVASIDYRLLQTGETEGVQKCLDDIEAAIADMRASHVELNIDPAKVGMRGKSAGSAAAMYLAGRPNPPNAIAVNRPMPLNVLDWPNYFTTITFQGMLDMGGQEIYEIYGMPWTGTPDINDFNDPNVIAYAQSLDTVNNMVARTGLREIWIQNEDLTDEPTTSGALIHHPNYSVAFNAKLQAIGYRSTFYGIGDTAPSLAHFFKNALFPVAESRVNVSLKTQDFPHVGNYATGFSPWIEGVDLVRFFRADFSKPKIPHPDGIHSIPQDVDEQVVEDYVIFCNTFGLGVIYTAMVSTLTLQDEINYLDWVINTMGLPVVAIEYGGEYYLTKYNVNYDPGNAKVIDEIWMDGSNNDYTDMLENWVPALYAIYPAFDHILVGASHQNTGSQRDQYRKVSWNGKLFAWMVSKQEQFGFLSISYHLYAGNTSGTPGEEDIIPVDSLDWTFLSEIPDGHKWVFTEGNYALLNETPEELANAEHYWQTVYDNHAVRDEFNIFALYQSSGYAVYAPTGITPLGTTFKNWLANSIPPLVETEIPSDWKRVRLVMNKRVRFKLKLPD